MQKNACCYHLLRWKHRQITKIMLANNGSAHRTIGRKIIQTMKLTALLLTAALMSAHAAADAQSIFLSGKDLPLKQIFTVIEKQTGYVVFSNRGDLTGTKPVSVSAYGMPLNDFLQQVFKDQPLNYKIVNRTIMLSRKLVTTNAAAPLVNISGVVLGSNSLPLAGATVKVKEKRSSTSTDKNGKFRIGMDIGQTLVFSYVGYSTREVKVSNEDEISIVLEARSSELNEVTVTTAYGLEKNKKELGYAVAKISGEEINRTNSGNILTGLTGKVSGLNISSLSPDMNNNSNVILRGLRSINETANNQPLFILNGSPLSFGSDQLAAGAVIDMLNSLNPNDVQDVTVLKGANGTALYGPEGVNGVIIINTKKGSAKKFDINFQTSTSWQKINFQRKIIQKDFGTGNILDADGKPVYDPLGSDLWGPRFDGSMVAIGRPDENGDLQTVPYTYNTSRFKFWDMARLTQNSLSLSQQDEKGDFYLALNHIDQTGVLPEDRQKRVNMLLNTGRTLNRAVKMRLNLLYDRNNANTGPSQIRTDNMPAHIPVTSYKDFLNDKWSDRNHYWADAGQNPYEVIANNRTQANVNVLAGNLELRITPLSWMTVVERVGLNYSGIVEKSTRAPLNYSDFAKMSGRPISVVDQLAGMSSNNQSQVSVNNDFMINTSHHMGDFGLRTTIGNSIREMAWKQTRVIIPDLSIPVFNPVYALNSNRSVLERDILARSNSAFATLMFDYKQKVFLEIVGRQDWDSKLARVARNHNFYAGANTSVLLSEIMPSLKSLKWMNMWKVRAALTTTANMNILPQQSARTLEAYGTFGTLPFFGYVKDNPNKKLRPEHILSQEYGTELVLFDNKLQFDISYYRQKNDGLILGVTSSIYSAAPTIDNAGVYNNYGMDLTLKINDLLKGRNGFFLDLSLLYATNNNKVLSLPDAMDGQLLTYVGNATRLVAKTGGHAYAFAVNDFLRTEDGKIVVDESTGIPMLDTRGGAPRTEGRVIPLYTAGLGINMGWKKFTFGGSAEYRGGNNQYNEAGPVDMRSGLLPATTYNNRAPFVVPNSVYMDGTGKYVDNKDIKVSSARDYFQQASYATYQFLTRADFFRLNELYLGYDFPMKGKIVKKIGAKIYGRDLWNIYTKDNINGDPLSVRGPGWNRQDVEQVGGYDSNAGGSVADAARLPGTSMFGFSFNVSF